MNEVDQFREAMAREQLVTDDPIIVDGRIHRFHVEGDRRGSRNGWYVLHAADRLFGCYGSWKEGITRTWCASSKSNLTAAEKQRLQIEAKQRKEAAIKEVYVLQAIAKTRAEKLWRNAVPANPQHPYLMRKNVKNYGLRQTNDKLLIPLFNKDGEICSLQYIDPNGGKRFLKDGQKKGCYFGIGKPKGLILIAEGYATAASIYEATDHAVAVAFDAGNLEHVAKALRHKYPDIKIAICADNDSHVSGNPGLTKALQAAAAVGGTIVEMRRQL